MPSSYLTTDDYPTYGLSSSTNPAQVIQASQMIDAYLKRPDGLVWSPDGNGAPAFMAALTPQMTFNSAGPIAPGQNVIISVTPATPGLIDVGEALILDRLSGDPQSNALCEVVNVVSTTFVEATQTLTITLKRVIFSHPGPCTLDKGMTIKQHKFMPDGRPLTTLAFTPIARLLSGQGRYGYGRRGAASKYMVDEFNLLASLSHFGGPPVWEMFPLENTGVDALTGQLWVPAGVMLSYYSEINLWYVAGFAAANIPSIIKLACAQLVVAIGNSLGLGDVKAYKAGDTQLQFFASSLLNADTKTQLDIYKAKLFV